MKNYYKRPGEVYVSIDTDTKEIINVLNLPQQKTISKLNSQEYYDKIIIEASNWETANEQSFTDVKTQVLALLNA